MNQDQIDWILRAEQNNALNPEQQAWLARARQAGVMPTVEGELNLGGQFARGALDPIVSLFKQKDILNYTSGNDIVGAMNDIDSGKIARVEDIPAFENMADDRRKSIEQYLLQPELRDQMRQFYKGNTNPFEFSKVTTGLDNWLNENLAIDPSQNDRFLNQVSRGFGQVISMVGQGAVLRGPGVVAAFAEGSAQTGVEAFEDAFQKTGDFETAYTASKWGNAIGLTEALPVVKLLKTLDKGSGGALSKKFKEVLIDGSAEGIQEFAQQVMQNAVAQNLYDPSRNVFTGAIEGGEVGFTVGSLASFLLSFIPGKQGKLNLGTTQDKPVLPSERTGLTGATLNASEGLSRAFGNKAVSVLDKYTNSPEAQSLRNDIEHFERFEGPDGTVKTRDWFETKQTTMGEVYAPVEAAFERVRNRWGGRNISQGTQQQILDHVNQTKVIDLNQQQQDALDLLKQGDESSYKKLSGKERKQVDLVNAADAVVQSIENVDTKFAEAGIQESTGRTGKIPTFFNRKVLRKNMGAFANWLVQNKYADDQAHGRRVVQSILANGGVAYTNDPDIQGSKASVNRPIDTKNIPQKFLETNLEKALPKYALRAASHIAHAGVFNSDKGNVLQRLQKIQDELNAQGQNMEAGDIQTIKDLSDAMLNRFNPVYNEALSAVNRGAAAFEALSTLGGATLSSVQEPFIMIERMGLGPFIRSLPAALNTLSRGLLRGVNRHLIDPSGSTRVAQDLGIALDAANAEVLTSAFTGDYSGIQDVFFKSPFGLFLHQWTTFNRIWGVNISTRVLQNWIDDSINKKMDPKIIGDLGLTHADLITMNQALDRAGMDLNEVLTANADPRNPNKQQAQQVLNSALPSGRTMKDVIRPAINRMVNESVIAPRATNRPMWMNDPRLTAFSQLKSFPIVFGNTVAKRMIKKLNPKNFKDMKPCDFTNLVVAGSAMLGAAYAMTAVKDALKGKDVRDRPWASEAETPKEFMNSQLGQAINQTGIYGPFSLLLDAYQYDPMGIFGPAVGEAINLMKHLAEFGEDKISASDLGYLLGERTAEVFGIFGKSSDLKQSMGDYFYNVIDEAVY